MGLDVGDVTVASDADWAELVKPVGTLTVANPDSLQAVTGQAFPKGSVDLTPDQVGLYLRTRNYGEDDTNRLLRQEALWRSWLAKVSAAGTPDAVPGETDSGLAPFVRTLAADQVDYQVLPVKVQARADAYAGVFVPLTADVQALMAQAVPFPAAAPPGSRPRVRVLDGSGQLDHGLAAARTLAANGAQIDGIGNASSFDVATTQFIISGSDHQSQAEGLRDALGVGDVVQSSDQSDSVDITVILGADALGKSSTQDGPSTTAVGG